MAGFFELLGKLRKHRVSHNASWIFLGQGANFLLQAGYFILLARVLGVREYGVFAGAFAIVNLVTPYSALGAGMLFMRYVTADRSRAATYWGNSLIVTTVATLMIAGVLFLIGPVVTKTGNHLLFVVLVIANCLFSQVANLGSLVFQTFEKMRWTAMLSLVTSLARFLVLVVMRFTLHHATAFQWSVGVLIASGCAACLTMALVRAEIGPATCEWSLIVRRVREGLGFSFAGTTQAAYNDVDKVMLSHYGLNRENGFYTLAYRVIDVATTPIASLDAAILPRFFRLGHGGTPKVIKLAAKSAAASLLLGAAIAGGVLLLAPLIPRLVGRRFCGRSDCAPMAVLDSSSSWDSPGNGERPYGFGSPEPAHGRTGNSGRSKPLAESLVDSCFWVDRRGVVQPRFRWAAGGVEFAVAAVGLEARPSPGDECSGGERGIFMNTRGTCAVVITFRSPAAVLDNLAKVRPQVEGLVVVDNGSPAELLVPLHAAAWELGFTLIENAVNLGIAAALNIGVRWAKAQGFQYVALFDQDSTVTEGFCQAMLAQYESHPQRDKVAVVTPEPGGAKHRPRPTPIGLRRMEVPLVAITSGSLMPVEIFDHCGWFQEELIIDCVDHEYCLRARSQGYTLAECRQAVLLVAVGSITSHHAFGLTIIAKHYSARRQYYITRNRLVMVQRFWKQQPAGAVARYGISCKT